MSIIISLLAVTAAADAIQLKPLTSGMTAKIGAYIPVRLPLASVKPAGVKKEPSDLKAPLYGELKLGGKVFNVIVDEPETGPSKLFVDANGNGDFSDDETPAWTPITRNNLTTMNGSAALNVGGKLGKANVKMYKFDPKDPSRPQYKTTLLYYSDYGYEGEVTIGGNKYNALLTNMSASGDFQGEAGKESSGVSLFIDVNGNSKMDNRGERFDVRSPFNIGGTTYEIANMKSDGSSFEIIKSSKTVAEVKPPQDVSPGKPAISFTAKTTDGKTVNFPSGYSGKIVLLDFWATWCGPCRAEIPGLVAAAEKYRDRGFTVLGISLDQPNSLDKLNQFTSENKMTWPQVYDGGGWKAEIAQLYAVDSIPRALLVDGTTGKVIATGNSLRGASLDKTIEEALTKAGK